MVPRSALDVFVVGSAVAVLQISQVVKFMIGDKCAQIDSLLGSIGLPDECFGQLLFIFYQSSMLLWLCR